MIQPLAGQRQKGESSKAAQACNDYLRMGPGRSVVGLHRQYQKGPKNPTPTQSLSTLQSWSRRYDWPGRAERYDERLEQEKNERAAEIMATGLALAHERVEELKTLARCLIEQVYEQGEDGVLHNLWLPDVKQIGSGSNTERVDIERWNSALVSDLRGVLDDLAKETGGRVHKQEVSGPEGGPVVVVNWDGVEDSG